MLATASPITEKRDTTKKRIIVARRPVFKKFTDITQGVRRSGAAAVDICHAASGKTDGYWEFDIKPWDIAAGSIIAKQAGALITGIRGEEFSIWDNQILATNGKIHGEMLKIITSTI